jgi:hypothetical protein
MWLWHPVIACFEFPMRGGKCELEMAIWLWYHDPNRDRGKACALAYAANAGLKIGVRSVVPMFLIAALVWLCGVNALPAMTLFGCLLVAVAVQGFGMFVIAILSLSAMCFAMRKGVLLWVDEDANPEFAKSAWPPACGKDNVAPLFSIGLILVIFMAGVMATPEKWIYETAAALALLVPPILWLAHKTAAKTIEECYQD